MELRIQSSVRNRPVRCRAFSPSSDPHPHSPPTSFTKDSLLFSRKKEEASLLALSAPLGRPPCECPCCPVPTDKGRMRPNHERLPARLTLSAVLVWMVAVCGIRHPSASFSIAQSLYLKAHCMGVRLGSWQACHGIRLRGLQTGWKFGHLRGGSDVELMVQCDTDRSIGASVSDAAKDFTLEMQRLAQSPSLTRARLHRLGIKRLIQLFRLRCPDDACSSKPDKEALIET